MDLAGAARARLFDGLDRRPARRALADAATSGRSTPGDVTSSSEGDPGGHVVGAARGRRRPVAARRQRGDRRSGADGATRASGPAGSRPGTPTASTSRPAGRSPTPGACSGCPPRRSASLAARWFPFGVHFIDGLVNTVRSIESTARQREALVALGTLAAGLAHEINNPASAATRAVDALAGASDSCLETLRRLAARPASPPEQFVALDALRRRIADADGRPRPRWARRPRGRAGRLARRRTTSTAAGCSPRRSRRRGGRGVVRAGWPRPSPARRWRPAVEWVASSRADRRPARRDQGVDRPDLRARRAR